MTIATRSRPVEILKDPNAVLDYGFVWSNWLKSDETISTSAWEAESGLTIETSPAAGINTSQETLQDGTVVPVGMLTFVWISGGVAGNKYLLRNRVSTSDGRTDDRTFRVHVIER